MNREQTIRELEEQFVFFDLTYLQEQLILEAINSKEWDLVADYDGCTGVPEFHINKVIFPCFVHDFHWQSGRGGIVSDRIFYEMMLAQGFPKWKARKRYLGVRLAWNLVYKWKHKRKCNVRDLTNYMKIWENKRLFTKFDK